MVVGEFDPYERMPDLPDHAPSRSLHMNDYPGEAEWTRRLRAAGIDPVSAFAQVMRLARVTASAAGDVSRTSGLLRPGAAELAAGATRRGASSSVSGMRWLGHSGQ